MTCVYVNHLLTVFYFFPVQSENAGIVFQIVLNPKDCIPEETGLSRLTGTQGACQKLKLASRNLKSVCNILILSQQNFMGLL